MCFLLIPQGREVVLVVLDKWEGGERKDRGGVNAFLLFHYILFLCSSLDNCISCIMRWPDSFRRR